MLRFLTDELIDTHCHLNFTGYDSIRDQLVNAAAAAGVMGILDMAVDLDSSRRSVDLSKQYPSVMATCGIDPEVLIPGSALSLGQLSDTHFKTQLTTWQDELNSLLTAHSSKLALLGECGMDSYHLYRAVKYGKLSRAEMDLSLARQEQLFRMQCELAQEYKLPLSVHSRNLEAKVLSIVNEYNVIAIMHSFTGSYKVMKKVVDSGHYLGVNGIITYGGATELLNSYKQLLGKVEAAKPKWFYERQVVFETDAPFLHPFDAKLQNSPEQIAEIYKFLVSELTSTGSV
jgi:TatD DNase family protein